MRGFTALSTALVGLLYVQSALTAPLPKPSSSSSAAKPHKTGSGSAGAGAGNSTSSSSGSTGSVSGPHYVVYNDEASTPAPDPKDIEGFNVLNLAFLLNSGKGGDVAGEWEKLSDAQRKSTLQKYDQAGIKIMVSAFGETEKPTTKGLKAETIAGTMADWVIKYGVHGIDVDYEDFDAIDGKGVQWIVDFTKALRKKLPQGKYLLTHAPVAPWFTKNGPYIKVHQQVGSMIDWYNLQFYNQGNNIYNTCDNLITKSSTQNPALLEIVANGVPIEKLVVGKPAVAKDATNGFIAPDQLGSCLAKAKKEHGYNSGAMTWEYHTDGSTKKWIQSVLKGTGSSTGSGSGTSSKPTSSKKPSSTKAAQPKKTA